jgi:hypothetical protein
MLLLVYFTMLIQQQKVYSIKLKGIVLNWEETEGDRCDIFGGITLQSRVEKGWFLEKKFKVVPIQAIGLYGRNGGKAPIILILESKCW